VDNTEDEGKSKRAIPQIFSKTFMYQLFFDILWVLFSVHNRESKEEKLKKSKWELLELPSRIASTKFYAPFRYTSNPHKLNPR